ncbi:ferredoxin-type protein NapF [Endozoicomonas sp. SCSIO W0465]|uniref:ferredoxin-type protein NapF n=1 Tax=Endozoicomonas sp. SCSIO W0465 TaxID=2918516 RepID=UPI002075AE1C|nr:ferredoxin-type protein NapF [Endozoicomonas sp. SCSIO W0465]USE34307.1 ferredoxin-type protein NapF [Endozoicomonas sp. SCSIO W0465]
MNVNSEQTILITMGAGNLISRRRFLTGSRQEGPVFRPPWTPAETEFIDQCRRCDDCIAVCETGLLKKGSGGFPEADFSRAGCSFCAACSDACQYLVTQRNVIQNNVTEKTEGTPWNILATINSHCLAMNRVHCRTCQESCAASAISFTLQTGGVAIPGIDTDQCTGCGECVSQCPIKAIAMMSNSEQPSSETAPARGIYQ